MNIYHMIESIIDSNGGSVRGRTAVQKLVYLANQKIPELDVPEFKPHYYGPYSAEVGAALARLVSYLFVSESRIPGNMAVGYEYSLTRDGKKIIESVKRDQKEAYNLIRGFVQECRAECGMNIQSLSFASKAFYLINNPGEGAPAASRGHLHEYAKDLRWEISADEIEKGIRLLEKLELVPATK